MSPHSPTRGTTSCTHLDAVGGCVGQCCKRDGVVRLEVRWGGSRGSDGVDEAPPVLQTADGAGAFAALAGTHYKQVDTQMAITCEQARPRTLRCHALMLS